MNKLDKQYTDLLQDILDNGVRKEDRTGTGTLSVFGRQIRHKMSEGFPLLTTKKMYFKGIVTELLWFLRGDTNIKYLVDNDCHIWDGDAYKNFEEWYNEHSGKEDYTGYYVPTKEEFIRLIKTDDEFAKKWGELGPVYGKQWRNWGKLTEPTITYNLGNVEKLMNGIDQIANLINDLKTNPDSRRLMVTAWNVAELDSMTLPPCHYGFQVYTRELSETERFKISLKSGDTPKGWGTISWVRNKEWNPNNETVVEVMNRLNLPKRAISLMWNQRSVDTFLGLPFNIASYGLLLEIIAKAVNMVPDELIGNLGDTHLYLNHIEQAKEQIGRELSFEERTKLLSDRVGCEIKETILHGEGQFETEVTQDANAFNIPKRTREPYPLPTLAFMKTNEFFKSLGDDLSLITHLDTSDFVIENYQSHPTIKAPLSN